MSTLVQPNKCIDCLPVAPMLVLQLKQRDTDNTAYQEHVVDSSVLGSATVVWNADTRQWIPVPRRQVKLRIKDKDSEYSELWQQASDTNPAIYNPSYIQHVGQYHKHSEGNCHEHHVQMNETPCTSWMECKANDQKRSEQTKEDNKNLFRNIRRRKDYKSQPYQEKQQRKGKSKTLLAIGAGNTDYDAVEWFVGRLSS